MKIISSLFLAILFSVSLSAQDTLFIDFFWGNGCPSCSRVKPEIETIKTKYPKVVFKEFEIYSDRKNLKLLQRKFKARKIPFKKQCVPAVFIEEECYTGYKGIMENLEASIQKRLTEN